MCRGLSPCSRFEALGVLLMEPTLEGFLYGSGRVSALRKENTTVCYLFFTQELRQDVSDTTSRRDTAVPDDFRKSMNAIAIRQPRRKRYRAQQERDDWPHRKYTLRTKRHQIGALEWPAIPPVAETPFPTAVKAGTIAPFLRNGTEPAPMKLIFISFRALRLLRPPGGVQLANRMSPPHTYED